MAVRLMATRRIIAACRGALLDFVNSARLDVFSTCTSIVQAHENLSASAGGVPGDAQKSSKGEQERITYEKSAGNAFMSSWLCHVL